jgi:replicative superfamily II helicase
VTLGNSELTENVDLAIVTIEKANSVVNHMIEDGTIHRLGVVVIDVSRMRV